MEGLESRFLLSGLETRSAGADPLALSTAVAGAARVAEVSTPVVGQIISNLNLSNDQLATISAATVVKETAGAHDQPENAQELPDLDQARVFGVLDAHEPADLYKITIHPGTQSIQVDFRWGTSLSSPPARLRLLNGQGEVLGEQPMAPWGASTLFTLDQPPGSETTLYVAVARDPAATAPFPDDGAPLSAAYDLAIFRQGPDSETDQGYLPTFPGTPGLPGQPNGGSGQTGPPSEILVPGTGPFSGSTPVTISVSNVSITPTGISLPVSPSEPASGLLGSHRPAPTYNQRDSADVDMSLVNTPISSRVPSSSSPETTTNDDADSRADAKPADVDLEATLSIALDALLGSNDANVDSPWRPPIPNGQTALNGGYSLPPLVGSALLDRREAGGQARGSIASVASLPPLDSLPSAERSGAAPARTLADRDLPASSPTRVRTLRRWAMAASLFGSAALMFSLYAPDLRSVMNDAKRNPKLRDAKAF